MHPRGLGLLLIEHYPSQAPIEVDIKTSPGKGNSWYEASTPCRNRCAIVECRAIPACGASPAID